MPLSWHPNEFSNCSLEVPNVKKKISSSGSGWEFQALIATLEILTHQGVQKTVTVRTETQTHARTTWNRMSITQSLVFFKLCLKRFKMFNLLNWLWYYRHSFHFQVLQWLNWMQNTWSLISTATIHPYERHFSFSSLKVICCFGEFDKETEAASINSKSLSYCRQFRTCFFSYWKSAK